MKRLGAALPLALLAMACLVVPAGALHAATPNDQSFFQQWALPMMQVPYAWEMTKGSTNVVVAVLDSGIDLSHPDLAPHILPLGCNVVADHTCPTDGQGTPATDIDGHGTAVAGIIAAVTDNRIGVSGVAWNASLLPVKVTSGGNGGDPTGSEADFVTGLRWAVDRGAKVLNFSFSEPCGTTESADMRAALAYAWDHGALPVASAGNGSGCPAGVYPAADTHVLAVASTGMNDTPSSFSNFGPWVRIAAPGEKIVTTTAGGLYATASGTSMAAPQVAGVAALLFAVPGATNTSVQNWILSTCDVPDGWNPAYGCGRVNAYRAVALATRGADPHTSPGAPLHTHLTAGLNNLLYRGRTWQVATALSSIDGKYTSVYAWDPVRAAWSTYLPGQPAASDLQVLQERGAYWIYVKADVDLVVTPSGNDPPPRLTLPAGWNNIALPAGTLPAPLQSLSGSIGAVYSWNPGTASWNGFFANAPRASDLAMLRADAAYWVYVPAQTIVTYHS